MELQKLRTRAAAMCIVAVLCWPSLARSQTAAQTGIETARVIVKYRSDSPLLRRRAQSSDVQRAGRAQELGARVGLALRGGAGVADDVQVLFGSGITSRQLASRLAAESDIEYAVPDERRQAFQVPSDPLYRSGPPIEQSSGGPEVGQWYLRAPAGEVRSSINVELAWDAAAPGTTIVLALLDTGVRFDHPDLLPVSAGGGLLPGYDMISDVDVANDGDGRDPDASDPGDWLTLDEVNDTQGPFHGCGTTARDSSWHGTKTGGVLAATTDNGIGMAGVGRGHVRVLPVRVLGKCGGFDSDIIAGMRWAAGLNVPGVPSNTNPARVLNLSLGGSGTCSQAYRDAVSAINAAGTVVVAAAGNTTGHAVGSPANCPGVIAVAALRHVGTKVGFSDLGLEIALSAPGGNCINVGPGTACIYPILTTANRGQTTPVPDSAGGSSYTDSFKASIGTSFSAPLVSGVAALMLSTQPALSPLEVRRLLQSTARPFPTTGGDNYDGTPVPQCALPRLIGTQQVDQLQCYCTTLTCGAGMLDAGTAVWAARGNAVVVARTGPGRVTSSPAGIDCGLHCGETFAGNSSVLLVATPDANAPGGHYTFDGWSGVCASFGTQPACNVATASIQSVGATFSYSGDGSSYSRAYMQEAYVAYYGRPGDPLGMSYWAVRMDGDAQSLGSVIAGFGASAEYNARLAGLAKTELVATIYRQILARDPDDAGLDYYVDELASGRRTLQTIALDILNGATGSDDTATVRNKLEVADYYTVSVAMGCAYGTAADGVDILATVTGSASTVSSAKASIDAWCGSH